MQEKASRSQGQNVDRSPSSTSDGSRMDCGMQQLSEVEEYLMGSNKKKIKIKIENKKNK